MKNTPVNINVLGVANSLRQFITTTVQASLRRSVVDTDERKLLELTKQSLLQIAYQLETASKFKEAT